MKTNIYNKVKGLVKAVLPFYLFTLLPMATACTGDLNTEPLTDQTLTPEKALANEGAFDQQVAKIYSAFAISGSDGSGSSDIVSSDAGEGTFTRCFWNLQELSTDEARIAWSDEGLNGLQFQQWTSTNRYFRLNFARMTLITALCNEFLIQSADKGVDELRAEVRALRAFSYYIMLDLYRTAPWTDETTGIGSYFPEQADAAKLFSFVESELKDVLNALPAKSATNYGKMNKYVAEMILANLYINAEVYGQGNHYNDAVVVLGDIINAGGYALTANYQDNFCYDNNESSEIIFPIIYDMDHAQTYGGTQYLIAASCGSGLSSKDILGLSNAEWAGMRAGQDLVERFEKGDKRALFWTTNESGDRSPEITSWSNYNEGYPCIKWTNKKKDGEMLDNQTFASTDYVFYRLADAYLLYVEAVKRGGNGDAGKAVSLYNEIQQRAFGDNSHNISSLDDLSLADLLDERSRELYFEGHRRTDLVRFGCFVDNLNWKWKGGSPGGIVKVDSKYNYFPIPQNDIDANPNLKQTKGY